jgi:hypothetical protein
VTRPARHRAVQFVAVAILALAAATISGPEAVTTAGADAPPPSMQAAALLSNDAVHGTETVGVQPPRIPAVGRAASIPSVRSVTLAVAAVAAGLACAGACRCSSWPADDRLPARGPLAWAGAGGRRAPPTRARGLTA